jgi:hypothetical protein
MGMYFDLLTEMRITLSEAACKREKDKRRLVSTGKLHRLSSTGERSVQTGPWRTAKYNISRDKIQNLPHLQAIRL